MFNATCITIDVSLRMLRSPDLAFYLGSVSSLAPRLYLWAIYAGRRCAVSGDISPSSVSIS